MIRGVLFDVDFTLIAPGPMFQATGYRAFCTRYGINVEEERFPAAVASAAALLDAPDDTPYDAEIFVAYTRHIIQRMGGTGPDVDACAREIYAEWASCQHFDLYDDVPAALGALARGGVQVGLVSNSHRCLASFQSHFELEGLVSAAISSPEHGFMKPHPTIFLAALQLMEIAPAESLMVGDSVRHDVEGALAAGMRAVLLHRGEQAHPMAEELASRGVPVIRSLDELPGMLGM